MVDSTKQDVQEIPEEPLKSDDVSRKPYVEKFFNREKDRVITLCMIGADKHADEK